jgi:putative hydrolase of the HAD superfamily
LIRAVAFDLWETLITETRDVARTQERLRLTRIEEILAARGHGALADRIEHAYRALWHRCQELYWSADVDVPCRRQVEHLLEELGLEPRALDEETLSALEHAYAHAAVEIPPRAVDGAQELLPELQSRGYRVGLISNTGRTPGYALRRVLDQLGLGRSIDAMVFSNEHGACKPQASIFEELRKGLQVDYREIVFVGDNLYADVHGAQRCGMRAIHFDPPDRGGAVAPPIDHGLEILADAHVTRLADVLEVVERMKDEG